jgi:hypothetical protein
MNPAARAIGRLVQVEKNFTALDPKQRMSGAFGAAFLHVNGEHVNVTCRHLQHVPAVVEKFWTTAIEHDAGRRMERVLLISHLWRPLKNGFVHS